MQVAGHIHIGEGARWASRACSRLNGNVALNMIRCIAMGALPVLVGMCLAWLVTDVLGGPGWLYLPVMIATVVPLVLLAIRILRLRMVNRYRRNLILRGVTNPLPWLLSVTPEGLTTLLGEVETRAPWAAVSEIFPVGPYWVLLVQGSASLVPKRNFSELAQERAFVSEVLERLSSDARGRSSEATRFASAG